MLRQAPLPLKDQILRPPGQSAPSHVLASASGQPVQYKNWTEGRLYQAYQAVQEGQSVRRAAELYHVPRSTLFDRVSGRVAFGTKSGPQ